MNTARNCIAVVPPTAAHTIASGRRLVLGATLAAIDANTIPATATAVCNAPESGSPVA